MDTGDVRPALRVQVRRRAVLTFGVAAAATLFLPDDTRVVRADVPINGPGTVYFPVTGHHVAGDLLEFWRENGGIERIGYPVSEEIRDGERGRQYFERGVIEYAPSTGLTFGRLGAEAAQDRREAAFRPITREEFGSDRADRRFFAETGYGVTGPFARFWETNGGVGRFGFPVSAALQEPVGENRAMITVQYFERGRLELYGDQVRIANLGRELVMAKRLGAEPVAQRLGAVEYSASIWPKWIDVNLKTQTLVGYEGNLAVQSFQVTTGKPGYETPPGVYRVFTKLKSDRMRGLDYDLPNVPWVMYFLSGGWAIHGAPWRSVYGPGTEREGSHGCVNSPVAGMAELYQWAPLGTTVVIHF